jgi:hypothetical protein
MSEDTWLELLLSFVTNEEKQTLQVPARDQRAAYDEGNGYDVLALQQSLNRFDPATFKIFQQSHCHDPVAVRVVTLHHLIAVEKGSSAPKAKTKTELEAHLVVKGGASSGEKPNVKGKTNDRFDKKSSLPAKESQPDQEELYESFPPKSPRRRLWDAVDEDS